MAKKTKKRRKRRIEPEFDVCPFFKLNVPTLSSLVE